MIARENKVEDFNSTLVEADPHPPSIACKAAETKAKITISNLDQLRYIQPIELSGATDLEVDLSKVTMSSQDVQKTLELLKKY